MAVNVQIEKSSNENNINTIKKFNRKIQASGILPKARSLRYNDRPLSDFTKKKIALKKIAKKKSIEKLIKLGKISENRSKGRHKR